MVEPSWVALSSPSKRLAVLGGVTHLGFMDVCAIGADRDGVLVIAKADGVTVPDVVLKLFADGGDAKYTPPATAWPAIRHLVIAQLRLAFGQDRQPVGLDQSLASAYPGLAIRYQQQP